MMCGSSVHQAAPRSARNFYSTGSAVPENAKLAAPVVRVGCEKTMTWDAALNGRLACDMLLIKFLVIRIS